MITMRMLKHKSTVILNDLKLKSNQFKEDKQEESKRINFIKLIHEPKNMILKA